MAGWLDPGREKTQITSSSVLWIRMQREGGRERGGEELKYIWEEEEEENNLLTCELGGYKADVKGLQPARLCVCMSVCGIHTSIIRHRGLIRVPLLLKANVTKLKHRGHHLQHGYRYKKGKNINIVVTFCSITWMCLSSGTDKNMCFFMVMYWTIWSNPIQMTNYLTITFIFFSLKNAALHKHRYSTEIACFSVNNTFRGTLISHFLRSNESNTLGKLLCVCMSLASVVVTYTESPHGRSSWCSWHPSSPGNYLCPAGRGSWCFR